MTRARDKASAVVASFTSTGIDDNADATAITIDSSENVALTGNATFVDSAEIQMGAGADLKIFSDGTNGALRANNGRVFIQTDTGVNLTKTGNTETMLIATPDGSVDLYHNNAVKIATTSGGVSVTGSMTASTGISSLGVYNNTTGTGANLVVDSGGGFARSTSSQRYKNTIADATHGLTELLTLRPVTYKHNGNGDTVFSGLIAEEVHTAGLSEFVDYSQDADGNDQPEALHYANMVSLCIKAIQEQEATITALTARITALEAE